MYDEREAEAAAFTWHAGICRVHHEQRILPSRACHSRRGVTAHDAPSVYTCQPPPIPEITPRNSLQLCALYMSAAPASLLCLSHTHRHTHTHTHKRRALQVLAIYACAASDAVQSFNNECRATESPTDVNCWRVKSIQGERRQKDRRVYALGRQCLELDTCGFFSLKRLSPFS